MISFSLKLKKAGKGNLPP